MRNLPRVAQLYLVVCYLLGLSAFGWLLLSYQGRPSPEDWLLGTALAVLAALAQIFVVARAGTSYSDHLTPAPLFAAFLLLPRPLLALAVCLAFLPEWLWYRRKWFIQTFNIATWLIALALGRWTLFLLGDHFRLERAFSLPAAAILVTIPVVLGTQTLLLALALKLARGQSFRETGLFVPTKLFVEVALLCAGWAFATAWLVHPLYGLAAAVPMALIFQALHVPNLLEEASTEPKTGLANMRHFNDVLVRDLERADRSSQPLSLLMCDLDYLR
ncbi:MAG: hypothetical protein HYY04_06715, partial [Chloroflexi bacterium]|nr:hypothetical protein [Chloroflexota bacterium]